MKEPNTDDRFDLVIMIMCDFSALSPVQRQALLRKFQTILKTGGLVLLDVYSLTAFANRQEGVCYERNSLHGFWSPPDYYGFLNTFKYDAEKVVLDKYTIIEETRSRTVYNWLQHFSSAMLGNEFAKAGFTVDKFYSDVAGLEFAEENTEFAIVARKK